MLNLILPDEVQVNIFIRRRGVTKHCGLGHMNIGFGGKYEGPQGGGVSSHAEIVLKLFFILNLFNFLFKTRVGKKVEK
jgi:hypothetical protein